MTFADMKSEEAQLEVLSQNSEESEFYSEEAAHRGALIVDEERQHGLLKAAKLHWRALLICSVAFTANMLGGYDNIANGASLALPSFFIYFGSVGPKGLYIASIWTSLWTAMSSLAQVVGAFVIGFVTDRFGRKWTACACSALTIAGTAVQYYAHAKGMLLAGKMINGFGLGGTMAVAVVYASEVAPLRLRGIVQQALVLTGIFMLGLGLAIVRIFVPNPAEQSFRDVFAIQWAVGGIATIAFACAPESPVYLVVHNKFAQAHKVMERIYGKQNSVDARLAFLIKEVREEQETQKELNSGSYVDCFKGVDRKRTLTVMFIYTAVNWGGAALLGQSIYFLIIAGLPAIHSFDVSIGGFGLSIIIVLISWTIESKFRRRDAFMLGCTLNFLFMLAIGCLYYAPGIGALWGIAVLMNVLIAFQTSFIQAMGYPIAAEISSYKLRAKTLAIGVISQAITSWFTSFVLPYIYNVDAGNLGARTGFIFAALSFLLMIGTWFFVPETSGLSTEEIDQAYVDKVSVRQFQTLPRGNKVVQNEA